jgi:DNA-binding MarR family transcriptional regulator
MPDATRSLESISLIALIRTARLTYGRAMRAALVDVGCDDIPSNGMFVIGAIGRDGAPLSEIIRGLGVSKQAAGQLIDTLVLRGYVERDTDPQDRRCLTLKLTERGLDAAAAQGAAIDRLDVDLLTRVGADHIAGTRETLAALIFHNREPQAAAQA